MAIKVYDGTVSADAVSVPISISEDWVYSFHVQWEANVTATLIIQESNKDKVDGEARRDDAVASTDWVNSSVTFPTNPAGAASRTFQNFHQSGSQFVRLLIDHTAGAGGRVQVWFHSKRVS